MFELLAIPAYLPAVLAIFIAGIAVGAISAVAARRRTLEPWVIRHCDAHIFFHARDGALTCDTILRWQLRANQPLSTLDLPMFVADPAPHSGEGILKQWNHDGEILQRGRTRKVTPQATLADSRALRLSFPLEGQQRMKKGEVIELSQHLCHSFEPVSNPHQLHLHIPFSARRIRVHLNFHDMDVGTPLAHTQDGKIPLSRHCASDATNPVRFLHKQRAIAASSDLCFSWDWPPSLSEDSKKTARQQKHIERFIAQANALGKPDKAIAKGSASVPPESQSAEDHPIIKAARARGVGTP